LDNVKVQLVAENQKTNPFDKLKKEETYVLKNLHFGFADATLLEESYPELNKLLSFLQENSDLKISVEGHTDNVGKHEFNLELSKKRSKTVAEFLTQKGISGKRISSKGNGDLYPIASNQTDTGRKQNRRVEIKIIRN